jgi:hypothetical protein
VTFAQTAVIRTVATDFAHVWMFSAFAVVQIPAKFDIHFIRTEVQFFGFAVLWANLLHVHFAIFFINCSW